jgi:hypothetical protein
MKNHQRALRRFQRERISRKRKKYLITQSTCGENNMNPVLKTLLNTPKTCSCWMCGNPRKYFKEITKQEKISTDQWRLEVKLIA